MKTIGTKKKRSKKSSTKSMPEFSGSKIYIGEQDARTLADAETILGDPRRKKEAVKQAKKIAKEKIDQAKAMMNVAAKNHVKKSRKKKKREAAFEE